MDKTLEEKIKELEEQLAVKQAYLSVGFSFPKATKLAKHIQEKVIGELKIIATKLAEGQESLQTTNVSASELSLDDINILKGLASTVKSKLQSKPTANGTVSIQESIQPSTQIVVNQGNSVKKAILLTTENVPKKLKNKVNSEEVVHIERTEDGRAMCVAPSGVRFHIPLDDLEMVAEQ